MKALYSPSARGFFFAGIHPAEAIPADAVAVAPRRYRELLAAQADGAEIVPDPATGRPAIARPRRDRRAELRRAVKREAGRRIEAVSPVWRQLNDMRDPTHPGAAARFAAIDAIRAASAAIEAEIAALPAAAAEAFSVAAHPAWPAEETA